MKKTIFIIFGLLIILVLVAVWVYLLFFAKTEDNLELFNGFMGGEEIAVEPLPVVQNEEAPTINLERPPLRQLTTRPVAGFNEVIEADGTKAVYFVEMGTGHLYSINLESGEEQRLSGTTVVQTREAYISDSGTTITIVTLNNTKAKNLSVFFLDRKNNSLTEVVSEVVQDLELKNNLLYYSVITPTGLDAYAFELSALSREKVFSLPFSEAVIQWGSGVAGPHYAYPKATYALLGFLYEIKGGKIARLPLDGFGFSALANEEKILFTKITEQNPRSYLFDRQTGETEDLRLVVLPEKCLAVNETKSMVCPIESKNSWPEQMPDLWYQGIFSFTDSLLQIDTGVILVDLFSESRREIDVLNLSYVTDFAAYFFTNKNDNSLWMYES